MAGLFSLDVAGIAQGVGSLLGGAGQFAKDISAAFSGKEPVSPEKMTELALKAQELDIRLQEGQNQLLTAQMEINKAEAQSTRFWVAGARPYLIWIAGTVIGAVYLPRAFATAVMWIIQVIHAGTLVPYPELNLTDILGLLGGLAGAGWGSYLRTQEKKAGVA